MTKFIFITGGVVSSIGKGAVAASLGRLLAGRGVGASSLRFDLCLNRDAGAMDPRGSHRAFAAGDGTKDPAGRADSVTAGQIYGEVLDRERRGHYGGGGVRVIPHVVDAVKSAVIRAAGDNPDVLLVELGGTIGDIEGMPFVEAIRQFMLERSGKDAALLHLVLLPRPPAGGDARTEPARHSAQKLRECGLCVDFLLCRSERPMDGDMRRKLALSANLRPERVIDVPDAGTVCEIPDGLRRQGLDDMLCDRLGLA